MQGKRRTATGPAMSAWGISQTKGRKEADKWFKKYAVEMHPKFL